jgi:hypothetical protein
MPSTAKATAMGAMLLPSVLTDCAKNIRRNCGCLSTEIADMS